MSEIFISYASEDRPWAEMLAAALEEQGWSTFWDRTIPTGKTWREVIGLELGEARCVVVLWSAASVKSGWVQEEADDGRERRILIPVCIEPVRPPIGFRSIQTADLSDWDGTQATPAFQRLVADITRLIGLPVTEARKDHERDEATLDLEIEEPEERQRAETEATRVKRLDEGFLAGLARTFFGSAPASAKPLRELGIRVRQHENGFEVVFPKNATDELLVESSRHFPAIEPISLVQLSGTQVSDLRPLAALPALRALKIDLSGAIDLGPLRGLTTLKVLNVSGTHVSDLSPLAGLSGLEELEFMDTEVTDLSPLKRLTALRSLGAGESFVQDIGPLAGLVALETLNLQNCEVHDLAPLRAHDKLQFLVLSQTRVTTLTPLHGLGSLEELWLDDTPVPRKEIEALREALPNLTIHA